MGRQSGEGRDRKMAPISQKIDCSKQRPSCSKGTGSREANRVGDKHQGSPLSSPSAWKRQLLPFLTFKKDCSNEAREFEPVRSHMRHPMGVNRILLQAEEGLKDCACSLYCAAVTSG